MRSAASTLRAISTRMPSWRAASASRSGGIALSLIRDRHRDDVAGQAGEIGQKSARILVGHHAGDDHQRTRHPLLEIAQRGGGDAAALGIVPAVEPDFRSPAGARSTSVPEASRCIRAGHSALTMPASNAAVLILNASIARSVAIASPALSN